MSQTRTKKPRSKSPAASARKLQAVPYFAQKMPIDVIAGLFQVSLSTVKRWAQDPEVLATLGEVADHVIETTKHAATDMLAQAQDTLMELMRDADDERVRLEAAKTACDRWGAPVVTKAESRAEVSGPGGAPVPVVTLAYHAAQELAREPIEARSVERETEALDAGAGEESE